MTNFPSTPPEDPMSSAARARRRMWLIIAAVVPVILLSSSSLIRNFAGGVRSGDISAEVGGVLVGIPLSAAVIFLVFVSLRMSAKRRVRVLNEKFPDAITIERLLYAQETDSVLRRLGEVGAKSPGMEYLSAAIDTHGVLIVDKYLIRRGWFPSQQVVDIEIARAPMITGPDRLCLVVLMEHGGTQLRIPFLVIAEKWIAVRGLKADEASALRARLLSRLGLRG